jgi:hypothetical protein
MKYVSNSRENQDLFILSVLDNKKNGTYIEIGCGEPINGNNTFLLEKEFNWKGVSIDIDKSLCDSFMMLRKNDILCDDATKLNYDTVFNKYAINNHIDFLQLDIDPPLNICIEVLKLIDFNKYSFSIIMYEHNLYLGNDEYRKESRRILEGYGYKRVISDVCHDFQPFEDWYINDNFMPNNNWKEFLSENINTNPTNLDKKINELFNKFLK